jgi:hypothetical protein
MSNVGELGMCVIDGKYGGLGDRWCNLMLMFFYGNCGGLPVHSENVKSMYTAVSCFNVLNGFL